jgi:ubiquinone/menaquinone biosynthesis C-methylase UbiE
VKQTHWDKVYETKAPNEVSWFEPHASKSVELIRATGVSPGEPIIDVGGGASFLVDDLVAAGYRDVTVLDISAVVLEKLRVRLGSAGSGTTLVHQDVLTLQLQKQYALWHDRAVFHFLVNQEDRKHYVNVLRRAVGPAGHVIIATFGPEGPQRCSGLPTMRYDHRALANELGPDFELVEWFLVVHHTPSNSPQQFLYSRFGRRVS